MKRLGPYTRIRKPSNAGPSPAVEAQTVVHSLVLSAPPILAISATFALLLSACAVDTGVVPPMDAMGPPDSTAGEGGAPDSAGPLPDSSFDDAGEVDSGTMDAAGLDSSAMDSALPDTGASDTGASDTGTPDTGTPDTGRPDTGTPDTGSPPPTCDSLFGGIRNYERCVGAETASACEFYSDPSSNMTCTQLCDTAGETCLGTWNEGYSDEPICRHRGERGGCSDSGDAYICRCTRPTS